MKESKLEVDKELKELKESIIEQRRNLDKASGNFDNKWGAFIESLIAGDLVSLLKEQGIPVREFESRKYLYRENRTVLGEYDLIAHNGESVVVTEVKSTLTKDKVDKFITKLHKFKKHRRFDPNKKIFGAMGFLEAEDGSVEYAEEKGFFAIRSPEGEFKVSRIVNSKDFKPKAF